MPTMAVSVLVVVVALVSGTIGWCLRAGQLTRRVPAKGSQDSAKKAREILRKLRDLASHVAADVGAHSTQVEQINEELQANGASESDAVCSAIDRLLAANNRMQAQLAMADERLQQQARQIESHVAEARTDALTGLANRRALDREMARRHAEFQRHRRSFSVMMIDVDHFKAFNDTHGHQAGDAVLCGLGKVLRKCAREMDVVARYGGEEFALVLPGTSIGDAARAAERVRKAIEDTPFRYGPIDLHVTVSVGVAELQDSEDGVGLIRRADAALYSSKRNGRNRIFWHDGTTAQPLPAPAAPDGGQRAQEGNNTETPKDSSPKASPSEARPATVPMPETSVSMATSNASTPVDRPTGDGLRDRRTFDDTLDRRLAQWRLGDAAPAILLVRIDDFESLVSRHGQSTGQLARKTAATLLKKTVGDMKMAAGFDPATLAVLLSDAHLAATVGAAERLREAAIRCPLKTETGEVPFTLSVSAAAAMIDDDAATLVSRAEEALDTASESGGDCSYFHSGNWAETATAAT